MEIAVVGGGAAGFFAAINIKTNYPGAIVTIFEKSNKLLSKVKVSGGGRCNVTNGTKSIKELVSGYPRGDKLLKKGFHVFSNLDMMKWLESRSVPLTTQEDGHVFPQSQDSQTIIDCFLNETRKLGVLIQKKASIDQIKIDGELISLHNTKENFCFGEFNKVVICTGGSPRRKGLIWLEDLGHEIVEPVPSLFTFNMPSEPVKDLMGVVVENTITSIQGTKLQANGPLLITHWGMSGPAILKLSSFGARKLYEKDYKFKLQVNWVNEKNNTFILKTLNQIIKENPMKNLANYRPYKLPERLWLFLLDKKSISNTKKWSELGKKGMNKLIEILSNDIYEVNGKTTFKEEFVTCGGVSLSSINASTMESKIVKNLYFAGEIMDVDGITGGYNFQAAWTTAFLAANLRSDSDLKA